LLASIVPLERVNLLAASTPGGISRKKANAKQEHDREWDLPESPEARFSSLVNKVGLSR
jgi:hypothetical protein